MKSPRTQLLACALGVLGLTTLGIAPLSAEPIPEDCKVGGFFVGCQAYTFKSFSVFQAIEKTEQAGGKVIEFYPNQILSPQSPDIKFSHNSPDDVIQQVKDQLVKHNIRAVNYGVVGGKDAAEWRQIFEFAKKMGLYGITTEDVGKLDEIEKLVKEYNICVCIHEHAKRPGDANYKVWDPKYVLSIVKDRDPRIGACADTGHWATSGLKPIDCIKLLKGRIMSVHLKDRPVIGELKPDCVYGTGVSDVAGILNELKQQGFKGNISIEYENNWEHSVPDVAQCVGFVRGHGTVN